MTMTELAESGRGMSVRALDLDTNYHAAGAGRAVVLLHGSGPGVSAWTNWKRVIPELAQDFHVIAPDMAGFGYTERNPDLHLDIKLWVKHLLGFLDALGLERISLVGNSFGGSLALAAAARFPDRFERLVLMGTPCDQFTMTPGLRAGWDYVPSREAMRATMAHFPCDPSFITAELVEDRYQASLIPGAQEGLRKLLVEPRPEGDTPLSGMPEHVVAKIIQPTLVLHGREDKVISVEMGLRLARAIPNAELHMFGQCGHWVQAERFDAFVALARRHLKG
ncbi:alpha/beta hydrolase [Sphingomonas sp. RB3P16]|uniref:alpha/beta fold hydrolase n=1 Tax=Parasphingomonas frigoris TaxID=3096163 RepID=UPI002FCB67DC